MKNDPDPLGERMKRDYEHRTRYYLPRRTYTLFRADGKAFHSGAGSRSGFRRTAGRQREDGGKRREDGGDRTRTRTPLSR